MKRFIVKLAGLIVASLLLFPFAMADEINPFANLVIEDGWMSGSVTAHYGIGYGVDIFKEIMVDCAVPEDPYPDEVLTVGYRFFSKADMQRALRAIGQSDQGKFTNNRTYTLYTGDWRAEAAADISREEAEEQAIQIGLAYFEALGVEIDPTPNDIYRLYDLDAYLDRVKPYYEHQYSDPDVFLERAEANWRRTNRYNTDKQSAYTTVSFTVMLEGMRLWSSPSYPAGFADEPDATFGFGIGAHVIVSDSGILVEAYTDHIPEIQSRRPLSAEEKDEIAESMRIHFQKSLILQPDGMSALSAALADSSNIGEISAGTDETTFQPEYMDKPVTYYSSQGVITGIKQYLFTLSETEWTPMWYIQSVNEYADGWRH